MQEGGVEVGLPTSLEGYKARRLYACYDPSNPRSPVSHGPKGLSTRRSIDGVRALRHNSALQTTQSHPTHASVVSREASIVPSHLPIF